MNILCIAFKDFSQKHFGGSKKVICECAALEELGHKVTLIGRNQSSTVLIDTTGNETVLCGHTRFPVAALRPLVEKKNQMADVENYIKDKSFDLCYVRYDLSTAGFIGMLKKLKNRCGKLYIEIPTYPYDKEYSGRLNDFRLRIDDFYAKQLKRYTDKIVSFYQIPGDSFYGVPVQVVPNGFDFSEISIVNAKDTSEDIHVAAVSSMRLWHGYERFIEGLHEYYSQGGTRNVYLYLVGNGREKQKYEALTQKYVLQKHVIFCGPLHGEALDALLEKCNLGVDSLGRHRTGISVLSSLKSREYGAKGIPIINSCVFHGITTCC